MLLLLELKTFGGSLELGLIHYKEVTRSSLRKVWLSEDVLDTSDGTNFTFLIDILELVHLVRLVDDTVTFLKVHQLVRFLPIEYITELAVIVTTTAFLALLGSSS